MVSEYIMANYLIELSPDLRDTYDIVSKLKWAVRQYDFDFFQEVLKVSKKRSYPRKVRTVLQTLESYLQSIQHGFIYTLSNGPVEGINSKIKNIKYSGYGYRNFRNLRYRILTSIRLTRKTKSLKKNIMKYIKQVDCKR